MTQRDQLVAHIQVQKETIRDLTKPVVSLEEFFEGNEDYGSIGCNLDGPYAVSAPDTRNWLKKALFSKAPVSVPTAPHPGPQGFYQILMEIRAREDVQDVLVEIADLDVDAIPGQSSEWPFSDLIYILTRATELDVQEWVAPLFPDTVEEGYFGDKPSHTPDLLPGYHVYRAWWD